ncbi:NAD(P)-binding protein [Penicillium angulare]|uniref:NAD(P)-binding protein n=1 Tax=Penicillium angulare TaxID=116970 RepID=UPI00254106F8|nr:NAD(P)-binding protein [Penicillium angulare]KAJ5257108.1 NAD(P)-binding protein [Penicillium angulare]
MARIFDGKLALVSGASRGNFNQKAYFGSLLTRIPGIGAGIALNFASKGCNLVLNYTSESSDTAATDLATELEKTYGVQVLSIRADISLRSECERMIQAAKDKFTDTKSGKFQIDIVINNAAIAFTGPFEEVKEDEFHRIYGVNVLGPILLTGACKPYLPTDRSGRIVLLSSINSKVGTEHTTLYSGTKGAIEAMTRVWARELAERATVNCVNPGAVATGQYLVAPDHIKEIIARWNPLTPLAPAREDLDTPELIEHGDKFGGRPAYIHEIAGIIATICSPEFGWSTGGIISANGGLSFSI